MSRLLENYETTEFGLGDYVSFDYNGERLTGTVTRVYNTRLLYNVEVGLYDYKRTYEVEVPNDNPRKENRLPYYMER